MLTLETESPAASSEDHQRPATDLKIALPEPNVRLDQDSEWCIVKQNGHWREIRFHDYDKIYAIPGLYERIFYSILKCNSPKVVRELLIEATTEANVAADSLRVLDLGAGNGMVGEELGKDGVEYLVGVDIIEEAARAVRRDRPDLYRDYLVTDMCDIPEEHRRRLASHEFNCLTCVAALGFGDIPARAFIEAFNLVSNNGWIAFNIKERFLNGSDSSGFSRLIDRMLRDGVLEARSRKRYRHRLATNGDDLHYVALVGLKRRDADVSFVED